MADEQFRQQLLDAGVLVDGGVPGLYGRTADYETVLEAITALATRVGAPNQAYRVHFPPVIPRQLLVQTDYLKSFPDLIGSVHTFHGDDRLHAQLLEKVESDEDWTSVLEPSEVVLRSAACHPVYPLCGGRVPEEGRGFEIHGWCFRHEPSLDPARMTAFRMHEFVRVGTPEQAQAHAERWLERGEQLLSSLSLDVEIDVANDPFFGRVGRVLATSQREEALKLEFLVPVTSKETRTAVTSVNRHQDHFGTTFGITTADGQVAHSSCFAIGLDRTALALFAAHGFDLAAWPADVRAMLWP
ncbi:MAG TPA: amino acid--[acyl-carrier-protein] ligase [Acidimicrobiales bacterium]|nr:amino acid--[acyl-carrier-protein] ligase [Acidimicrobiales bacterium]